MYAFEGTNDLGDTVVLDRTRTFYYLGQASNAGLTTTLDASINWRTYTFSSSVVPLFFVELISGLKWALTAMKKSGNSYTLTLWQNNQSSVPRIFCFGQPPVSSIGNPNDNSLVLYNENGQIMFDGTRNCLYTPAIADYYPAPTSFPFSSGSFGNPSTQILSYTGTLPSSMAIHCPSIAHIDVEAYYSAMGRFHFMTARSGCTLSGGRPYSSWNLSPVSYAQGSQGSWIDQSNLGLHINAPIIDIARYT